MSRTVFSYLRRLIFSLACILVGQMCFAQAHSGWWRSTLYPIGWTADQEVDFWTDPFLQDFSFAGYHRSEQPLPSVEGPVFDASIYGADPTGVIDSTSAIQAAIDAAASAGGGVVFLPVGNFTLSLPHGATEVLRISSSGIVLRGAGVGQTKLINTSTQMRQRAVIAVRPTSGANWRVEVGTPVLITADLSGPTKVIPVADSGSFFVGEWVVLRADATTEFIADLSMTDLWGSEQARTFLGGPLFYRQIIAVDASASVIVVDAPIRFALLTRDNARVSWTSTLLEEVGLEHFSIGNVQHTGTTGWGEEDYSNPALSAFDAHDSWLVRWIGARNSWMNSVASFQPPANDRPVHMLSNGVLLQNARAITLQDVEMQRPQYGGGGGNGYMIRFASAQECLARDCIVRWNRHGFVFSGMQTSGNVILRGLAQRTNWQAQGGYTNGRGSDHHMHLSQSNLIDGVTLDEDFFQAAWRALWGNVPHGLTATQSVYWNLNGLRYFQGRSSIVETEQFGYGYVIGTRGTAPGAITLRAQGQRTDPVDFLEGIGAGETLWPQSLFEDQLSRRIGDYDPGPADVFVFAPQIVAFPERRIELQAIASVEGVAGEGAWLWTQVDGPRQAHIVDPTSSITTVMVDTPGVYQFMATYNRGDWSNHAIATLWVQSPAAEEFHYPATAATWGRDGTHANTAFGGTHLLEVKVDGVSYSRESFVRFDLPQFDGPIASAKLSMVSFSQGLATLEHTISTVAASGWNEESLTWNSRPPVLDVIGTVEVIEMLPWELDVTDAVNAATGAVAFKIAASRNFGSQGWMSYVGRIHETQAYRPVLSVKVDNASLSYAEWIATDTQIPLEQQSPTADASGDGRSNLLAFFHGLDPREAVNEPLVVLGFLNEKPSLNWQQNVLAPGLHYAVEYSTDLSLGSWKPATGSYRISDISPPQPLQWMEWVSDQPIPDTLFLRLRVGLEE